MEKQRPNNIEQVRKTLLQLGKENHYLLSKPLEDWSEGDFSSYSAAVLANQIAKDSILLKDVQLQDIADELRVRLYEGGTVTSQGVYRKIQQLIEDYENYLIINPE